MPDPTRKTPPDRLPMLYRSGVLEVETRADANGGDRKVYRFSVSSEAKVERWFGIEQLTHTSAALDRTFLRAGLPVMADDMIGGHNGVHVGVFENDAIENGKLRGDVRFSSSAKGREVEQDVADGIRRQVSIGYRVNKFRVEKGEAGAPDMYVATRWAPKEVTILPLGADISVGPGRAADQEFGVEFETPTEVGLEEEVAEMENEPTRGSQAPSTRSPAPAPAPVITQEGPPPPAPNVRDLGQEAADISDLCNAQGLSERAPGWIREKLSPDQVARKILALRATAPAPAPASETIPMSPKDGKRYSYSRALRLLVEGKDPEQFDGLEGETHKELMRSHPQDVPYHGGILVPTRTRALDSMTPTKGPEIVATEQGELIEILRNKARVAALGARILTGLQGPIAFPKQTGAITVYWVGENPASNVPDSDPTLGLVILAPKTLQGTTAYARQLLAQTTVDVEGMIRGDLGSGHALAADLAAIHGVGAAGQPVGIYSAPDVLSHGVGGVPDFADITTMEGLIAQANADTGALGWLTTPLMAALLMGTPEHATAQMAGFIWRGNVSEGVMGGYRAMSTNQCSKTLGAGSDEHAFIFGNWGDCIIGLWNAMELIVDPLSQKKKALIEVTSFQMADVILRHGQSFCKGTGAKIA